MIRNTIALLLTGSLLLAGCTRQTASAEEPAADEQAAPRAPRTEPTAEALRKILDKNASFRLTQYPVGFWNYLSISNPEHRATMTEDEVQDWADAGFTLVQGPRVNASKPGEVELMTDMLDWAHARDMKIILWDARHYNAETGVAEIVADFGDHPAMFGLHVVDEPVGERRHFWFSEVARVRRQLPDHLFPMMNIGPHHPGNEEYIGVESYDQFIDEAAEEGNVDFLCYDNYVQMNPGQEGWDSYYANLRKMREGGWRHGLPYWSTVLSAGHWRYRRPNYDELRWQFNTAVASGAAGIQYFFYYMREPHFNYVNPPVDEFWEKTQTYWDMRKVHRSFHRRYGDLFLGLTPTRVTFIGGKAWGDGDAFTPNEILTEARMLHDGTEGLIGEFIDAEGQRYVMVVNNSTDTPAYVILGFAGGEDTKIYNYGWDGKEHEGAAHCVAVQGVKDGMRKAGYWLAPGEELLQRVDSELIRNSELSVAMRAIHESPAAEPTEGVDTPGETDPAEPTHQPPTDN